MPKRTIVASVLLLVSLLPAVLYAQMRHRGAPRASCLSYDCVPVESLDLDNEQRAAIEKLDRAYNEKKTTLQSDLMRKRLELQSVFRNPQADEQKVRSIAEEVSQLQDQCLAAVIEHQIRVRALLKPEQLRRWCTLGPCLAKGPGREP
ncbi:MAG TPA: periplasmic heavy metal sensor [Syntrophobacteraceae bacterium]|nr:periplasmic heavy metal sensor [Syntrophobacteraceae bacterium]